MGKALEGAALIGGVIAAEALTAIFDPAITVNPAFQKAMFAIGMMGVSMEAGAIAEALTANRGMGITTRQAAACRQIVYGQQRVGGITIYESTTGSSNDQYNYIIVLAGHEVESIQNLYLDGRQVHWLGSGPGYTVRNGVGFGGVASNGTYTGPNGQQYNFGGTGHSGIYCEARWGDQADGDVMGSMTANDPNWAASSSGSPWVGGCCYIYLKIEYNTNVFPGPPEIRLTINGKNNIWDPRTSSTGFTSNWALIAADVITDTQFGLGDNTVNQAQLIAAANVCDETITLAETTTGGGHLTEANYCTNYHYDTSVAPMDALATMMPGAQGRISRIGGEWFIWPAYWQGPSFNWDDNALTADVNWSGYRGRRDLFNRVGGTYIAPTYPYNAAGNLYDLNGFYNGTAQNNFPFAFQPTNYPQYAQDVLHGYASDQWLNEDGGSPLYKELSLQTVLSVSQAQRCAKIHLLRNRQQGSGTFEMNLAAWEMQPTDVMEFTFAAMGWSEKLLEVTGVGFHVGEDKNGSQCIRCSVNVIETDPSVYSWSSTEELTVLDVPASATQTPYSPAPPTGMSLTSGAATAIVQPDGTVIPQIEVQWDTPEDILTKQIQVQYQQVGAAAWLSAPPVDVSLNLCYLSGVIAGQAYNVRIRAARANGAVSAWDEIDGYTVSITLSVVTDFSLSEGSLVGEAFTDGTAAIIVEPFTAIVGALSVSILPAGAYTISGLAQTTLYWVYYIDPTFAGGAITPIATTNEADFLGKVGYFLIGTLITPYTGSSGGLAYAPSSYSDTGSRTTSNAPNAYDGSNTTWARVTSQSNANAVNLHAITTFGNCTFAGFPMFTTTTTMTLSVIASVGVSGDGGTATITATVGGTATTLLSTTSGVASTTYTLSLASGTDLASISINVQAAASATPLSGDSAAVSINVYEIFVS